MTGRQNLLILAISAVLLAPGLLSAQDKDSSKGVQPAGPSKGKSISELPGTQCTDEKPADSANGSLELNGCPVDILDNSTATADIEIRGCQGVITDVDIGIDITHSWVGDLVISVASAEAGSVTLLDRNGCPGDDIFAVADDDATFPMNGECAGQTPTIEGDYYPVDPLAYFKGQQGGGVWTMTVQDEAGADQGTLNNWSVDLTCDEGEPRAEFEVNKVFTDNNPQDVEVTLSCFTGLPLVQSQMISESQNVTFIVKSFNSGELDCDITEFDVTGYSAVYETGNIESDTSCSYDNLGFGSEKICTITNSPDFVEIDVNKDWVIDGKGGDLLDPQYKLVLRCDNEISGGTIANNGNWRKTLYKGVSNGVADTSYSAEVIPSWDGGTSCWVNETVYDSSVEVSSNCGTSKTPGLTVELDGGDSCTVTNTVFYEGIPTLNQYGLMVLALLMLGMGFVGFRRFA